MHRKQCEKVTVEGLQVPSAVDQPAYQASDKKGPAEGAWSAGSWARPAKSSEWTTGPAQKQPASWEGWKEPRVPQQTGDHYTEATSAAWKTSSWGSVGEAPPTTQLGVWTSADKPGGGDRRYGSWDPPAKKRKKGHEGKGGRRYG